MRLERDSIPLDKEFPFQISEVELNPSNSHPGTWHWHSYFEITWVLEGKGNYFVNGQEYRAAWLEASGRQNEAFGYDLFAGVCSREDQYF